MRASFTAAGYLVTRITVTAAAIPEPSPIVLFASGLLVIPGTGYYCQKRGLRRT
ncbi:MAG TPA: hypothetical protein VGB12_07670 [bacterium]|jgi:hypothetical protein